MPRLLHHFMLSAYHTPLSNFLCYHTLVTFGMESPPTTPQKKKIYLKDLGDILNVSRVL